jgi:hypothetical protein
VAEQGGWPEGGGVTLAVGGGIMIAALILVLCLGSVEASRQEDWVRGSASINI